MHLKGWVINNTQGVFIEAEAEPDVLQRFLLRIEREKPAISFIQSSGAYATSTPCPTDKFEIRESADGAKTALILPDIATCSECQTGDFRSQQSALPLSVHQLHQLRAALQHYRSAALRSPAHLDADFRDVPGVFGGIPQSPRPAISRAAERMCEMRSASGVVGPNWRDRSAKSDDALRRTAWAIKDGLIVAVKGLGGFHLMVDAANESAVRRLRQRKRREEKPLRADVSVAAGGCRVRNR